MDFSKMRHRIVFLRPAAEKVNSLLENVPLWVPFKPTETEFDSSVHLETDPNDGKLRFLSDNGAEIPAAEIKKRYAVWAHVAPMTGREYQEAQKLREETTYNILTRYFNGITAEMKIFYNNVMFDIISVLNVGELNEQLKIVAKELDRYGKEIG